MIIFATIVLLVFQKKPIELIFDRFFYLIFICKVNPKTSENLYFIGQSYLTVI